MKLNMKIVFIIHNITRAAGTEKATIQLSNSLIRRGFNTEIISIESKKNSVPFFKISPNTIVHHINGSNSKILNFLKVRTVLKHIKPDIICGTGHNISFFLPFIKNSGSKTIALEHIDFESIPKWSKMLMKFSYPKLSAVTVLSETARQKVLKLSHKIAVIPNHITVGHKQSTLGESRIIMVGRISKEKAYERILSVAEGLQQKDPNWKIDIYGGGDNDNIRHLEALFMKNNLRNIIIHSPVTNIQEKYLNSSIFMISSKFEAFPLVVLEAKSFGLPVIGFRNEGTESLIKDNEDGFIVDTEAEALNKLELLITDPLLRSTMAKKGLNNVKEFEEEKIVTKWMSLFNELINNSDDTN